MIPVDNINVGLLWFLLAWIGFDLTSYTNFFNEFDFYLLLKQTGWTVSYSVNGRIWVFMWPVEAECGSV